MDRKKLRLLMWITASVMILLIASGIYIVLTKDKPVSKNSSATTPTASPPASSTKKDDETTSTQPPSPVASPNNTGNNSTSQPTHTPPKPWFKLELTLASQAGNEIVIRANVIGTATGTCSVELSRPGLPSLKRSGDIVQDSQFKKVYCGFNIPVSQVYINGTWNMKMTATVDKVASDPISSKIEVRR